MSYKYDHMKIMLSKERVSSCWINESIVSFNDEGILIHLIGQNKLDIIRCAARKINNQGLKKVALVGKHWNLKYCWAFWQGYRSSKGQQNIIWPDLTKKDIKILHDKIEIIDWVRKIINLPSEELGPEEMVQCIINMISSVTDKENIKYNIIKSDFLLNKKYYGLYYVGRSSYRKPVLLTLDYNNNCKSQNQILFSLVGKGITFDTGGYCLKDSNSMASMKSDMAGAAMLAGALALSIKYGLNKRVRLIICCADNMINGNAIKLGDIINYRNGKSVEIVNSDAEGRLILADGLIDASLSHSKFIIDCATLTGAAQIAVGNDYNAIFGFDDKLISKFMQVAKEENELFWNLPLNDFHRRCLSSNFADISNISKNKNYAPASTAAAFLSYFVKNYNNDWLHIDCSASFYNEETDQWAAGSTGLGVSTIASFIMKESKE